MLENRGTYLVATMLVATGVAVAFGLVDPRPVGTGPQAPVTYENVDSVNGGAAGSDNSRGIGLLGTLLGLLGIRQRMATAKVQKHLETVAADAIQRQFDTDFKLLGAPDVR